MQVYKELKVLTARPTEKDHKKVKHHLYGFLNVKKNFSTGQWQKILLKKIKKIKKKNKNKKKINKKNLYFKTIKSGMKKIQKINITLKHKIRK